MNFYATLIQFSHIIFFVFLIPFHFFCNEVVLSLADYYYFVSNVDILYIIQIKVDQSSDQKIHEKIEVSKHREKKI